MCSTRFNEYVAIFLYVAFFDGLLFSADIKLRAV